MQLDDLTFPAPLKQDRTFERNNADLRINADVHDHGQIIPVFITRQPRSRLRHIDLLLITEGDRTHHGHIKHITRLIQDRANYNCTAYVCPLCVRPFYSEIAFKNHWSQCGIREPTIARLPDRGTIKF